MSRLLSIWLLALAVAPLAALPIKPDGKPSPVNRPAERQYLPARVGSSVERASAINPIYEQMRYRYTEAGFQESLLAVLTPDFRIWGLLLFLIAVLRYFRWYKPRAAVAARPPAEIIEFPVMRDAA